MAEMLLLNVTTQIVSVFVGRNPIAPSELPGLIKSVHSALADPDGPGSEIGPPRPTLTQIRRSVRPDAIISFIDGKPYKQLKRHLRTNGLTPAEYREQYGLPSDYPIVAATYSAQRSMRAKMAGFGRKPGQKAPRRRPRS